MKIFLCVYDDAENNLGQIEGLEDMDFTHPIEKEDLIERIADIVKMKKFPENTPSFGRKRMTFAIRDNEQVDIGTFSIPKIAVDEIRNLKGFEYVGMGEDHINKFDELITLRIPEKKEG